MQFERRTVASAHARLLRPDTDESFEQRGNTLGGEWGGKAADQGEHPSASHAPDPERGTRVPGAGGCAESREGTPGDEVHRFAPPPHGRFAPRELLRAEAKSRPGGGRHDVAGVRDRVGGSAGPSAQPGPPRGVSSLALSKGVHPERRRAATPLGVAALEDKIVQQAVVTILNAIYEEDFLGFSYGFRPGRSQHQALDALTQKRVNYVLDADIRGFLDSISHEWMLKFVQHRVADRRILRLIQKWLKAGVMEGGGWTETETGTPQGAVLSPLLANIYLHYVFDLWVQAWRKKHAQGDVVVVRYADDMILGFQAQAEADRFLEDLRERLGKFGLELHPDKARRIEFGRHAEQDRKRRGEGKPETFDFLGFTHISGKNRKGYFTVKRRTIAKRLRAKLQEIKQHLRRRRHEPVARTGEWLQSVVQGYFLYHAVPGNLDSLGTFRTRLTRLWRTQLLHRSQRHRCNWERMVRLAERWLPKPRVMHPWPTQRFAARHPR